jgi:hypothetical protein
MKGIGCPWRWIGRLVVHQMKEIEKLFVVHDSVHPIKISIVHQKHDGENRPKIEPAILIYFIVEGSVFRNIFIVDKYYRDYSKNKNG